ncbi:hydroxymethylglutaryl-CoA lyase [Kerstersia gyiorum]|uniref:hydroxymethylglutaryl-CoA lyase n=2 Tax=Kerstersia gyiorum TaxID=206506 RepID=A0A4V2F0G1_9BURK|nr:hydroxymethylglutaryl-CoA lyase [Kerstersia gyiorum]MCP1634173.1 hydroxymethylglutaryl-CoA lyase [Kerstersia gyiorum]MCP1637669.1 hydroxymethylglutaryl-CoA lyase [Kerstersia gyiorum]MCP1670625.1 hydroxymethylglutaryl-CoA lyase [Kerstersia gyiorum]MCP1683383.1 hydroxymethylglutaryl-CoA lyase [Kerstersia gyiorum]MCP1708533.1 hydroxymethylglutaryl-CoA lyase [Kerstersia gyiorum]
MQEALKHAMHPVRIVEVGPRDGLQNEARILPPATRAQLVQMLAQAGLRHIEAGAFVSPRWVPQMRGSDEVLWLLLEQPGLHLSALVPNEQGMRSALACGCREVAVFAAASETFSQRNTNCSIDESLVRFEPVAALAREHGVSLRGYISCVVDCPYEGAIAPGRVADLCLKLQQLGCDEISLGDTTGAGTPRQIRQLVDACAAAVPLAMLAGHFHDTYGMAVANVLAALEAGITVFDASVSGLGGCPYSPGASGNLATEDLVYLLEGLGLPTGIDLDSLVDAGAWIDTVLERQTASRVARARLAARTVRV